MEPPRTVALLGSFYYNLTFLRKAPPSWWGCGAAPHHGRRMCADRSRRTLGKRKAAIHDEAFLSSVKACWNEDDNSASCFFTFNLKKKTLFLVAFPAGCWQLPPTSFLFRWNIQIGILCLFVTHPYFSPRRRKLSSSTPTPD